jgi:hypothetical protein
MTVFLKYKVQFEIPWKFFELPKDGVQIARDYP